MRYYDSKDKAVDLIFGVHAETLGRNGNDKLFFKMIPSALLTQRLIFARCSFSTSLGLFRILKLAANNGAEMCVYCMLNNVT